MTDENAARGRLFVAAIEWAAGGRGLPLVDACVEALVHGLDTPSLRLLAGATAAGADEEAAAFGPQGFDELDFEIGVRLTTEAIVDGARLAALRYLAHPAQPHALAHELSRAYVAAGYPDVLGAWSGLEDWYDLTDARMLDADIVEVDRAVHAAAIALTERFPTRGIDLTSVL